MSEAPPGLSNPQIARYGRQLILPAFGAPAQRSLCASSVLVIGAGGLGCPAILYLAAAGVGRLGIVDHDVVDVSNLHRQVAHREAAAGTPKAESAKAAALGVNSSIEVEAVCEKLSSGNALELFRRYDVVVDATDNPGTRYLINDACVLAGVPLVSGAALGMDGQLSVYNFKGGPCYRCMYPDPPARSTFTSCSDGGVLGPVPGLIGVQQAMEAIKVVTGIGKTLSQRLLVYNAEDALFRVMKLRPRSSTCAVCGDEPTITSLADTDEFCVCRDVPSIEAPPKARTDGAAAAISATCEEYAAAVAEGEPHVLLDVRVPVQFGICSLPGAVNLPLARLVDHPETLTEAVGDAPPKVFVVCRRGIDSLTAAEVLRSRGLDAVNIAGGLQRWAADVDPSFPVY